MKAKQLIVSCPAKVIIHGEHAVVYGKSALGSSINLRTYGVLKPSEDIEERIQSVLHVIIPQLNIDDSWPIDSFREIPKLDCSNTDKIIKYLDSLASHVSYSSDSPNRLATDLSIYLFTQILDIRSLPKHTSIEVFIFSEGPLGAGLGSSAAIAACLAALFLGYPQNTACNHDDHQDICEIIHSALLIDFLGTNKLHTCNALDDSTLQKINEWAFAAETIVHGTPSGIDNTICTYGGTILFKGGQMTRLKSFSEKLGLKILLIDSKIPKTTKKMVGNVREKHELYPSVINPMLESIGCITVMAIDEYKLLSNQISTSAPDYTKIEELIRINQCLLSAIGVSHPIIDGICNLANTHGFAAKLTGGGGGGCVIVLITSANESKLQFLLDNLSRDGYYYWETKLGVNGITMHSCS